MTLHELFDEHLGDSYPEGCRGVSVAGIDLITLDADIAGAVQAFLNGGALNEDRRVVLVGCAREAEQVAALVPSHARQYFTRLAQLAQATLDAAPDPAA